MRALKVLVVVLGLLLVAGVIALAMLVAARIERAPQARASAGPIHQALPPGSRILATELSGDRLLVRVALADGGEALLLYDARSGAPVAVIEGTPAR